jgi:adenylate cyclase
LADRPSRKLAVILHADVVGSTELVQRDESLAHERIQDSFRRFSETIQAYSGITREIRGDALVAEFSRGSDAVSAAIGYQAANAIYDEALPDVIRPVVRIGIAMGEVVVEDNTITGEGVILAQRLEQLSEPGGVCVQGAVYETVPKRLPFDYTNMGEKALKGFVEPVRVYAVLLKAGEAPPMPEPGETPLAELPDIPSIAVLPFTNMSGDPDQEYFSDGITEDIITELSRFGELHVTARNSSFFYKGRAMKVQDIGRELGVAYVLEGSVRKAGNRIRVTAQMVEAETGNHVWAERYDRDLDDIFAVQDELTLTIVSVLTTHLQSAVVESGYRKPTENLTAYDYYLRGRWLFIHGNVEDRTAIELLEKAIEVDPRFALAYATAAQVYSYQLYSLRPWAAEPEARSKDYIEQALAFGGRDPKIHVSAAEVYISFGEFDLAKHHVDYAIQVNPNDTYIMHIYGFVQAYLGDAAEGLKRIKQAAQMEVHVPDFLWEAQSEVHYLLHDYEAAIDSLSHWRDPPLHSHAQLAACYAQLGRMNAAQREVALYHQLKPEDADFPRYAAQHARICKRQKDADHWLEGYRKAGLLD